MYFPYLRNGNNYICSIELVIRFKGDETNKVNAQFWIYSYKISIIEIQVINMYEKSININNIIIYSENFTYLIIIFYLVETNAK